jgi:hypothetical protein
MATSRIGLLSTLALILGAGGSASQALAVVTEGYSDNPCTAKITSAAMHYATTSPNRVVWASNGPMVYYTMALTCKDGQAYTASFQKDAYDFILDAQFYDRAIYDSKYFYGPHPYVNLQADGNLAFGNGYINGILTTSLRIYNPSSMLLGFVTSYWIGRDPRDTPRANIQTWSSVSEASTALSALPKYDPAKEAVTNAYEKFYPAFPWDGSTENRSGGLGSTPRPIIRVNYTGPTGTLAGNGAPKYAATVYCFPGQGDANLFNRPVIVSDAFDPSNGRSAWKVYSDGKTGKLLSPNDPNGLRAYGYDVFFVDFSQGGGNLLINASLFLKVVEWMHIRTMSPMLVGGPSMGGIVSRLAMLYSIPENNLANGAGAVGKDLATRVKGFLSIDAPNQGANIAPSMQKAIYDASQSSAVNLIADFMGENNTASDEWQELSVPAAHQMLYSHYYSSTGAPSGQAHNGFYAYLSSLGSGKALGDSRGYRKDIPKVSIAYSNFRRPLPGKDAFTQFTAGNLDVNKGPVSVFLRHFSAGGSATDAAAEWHEMEPGSTGDWYFSPFDGKSQKYVYPSSFSNETYCGTFMPIRSALDLGGGFDPLNPVTTDETEMAAYTPFDAVYYMRDSYNGYADMHVPSRPRSYTGDEMRYEHVIFDDQLMTKLISGVRYLEDFQEKKVVTVPIFDPGHKTLTALGPASNSPSVRAAFQWNGSSGQYNTYSFTLPPANRANLTDGLAKVYEGHFDNDLWMDILVAQGHKWSSADLLLSSATDNTQLTPFSLSRPEMGENAKIAIADVNADGLDDIVTLGSPGQTGVLVDLSDGNGGFNPVRQGNAAFAQAALRPEVKVLTGDFNGDYYDDIVLIGGIDWNDIRAAWSNGNGLFTYQTISGSSGLAWPAAQRGARILVGAFQQRGVASVAVVNGGSIATAAFGGGTASVITSPLGTGSNPFGTWMADPRATLVTADFNGDGMTDIALTGVPGWASVPVAFCTGSGAFRITNMGLADFPGWAASAHVQATAADVNEDGKADLIISGGFGWASAPVAYSNGDGTFNVVNLGTQAYGAQAGQLGAKRIAHPLSLLW